MPPDRGERRYTQLRRLFSDSSSPASPEQRAAALAGLVPPVLELEERSAVDELSTARVTLQTSASDPVSLAELLNAPVAPAQPQPQPQPLPRESLAQIDAQLDPLVEVPPPPSTSPETTTTTSVRAVSAPSSGAPSISGDREHDDDDSDSDTTVCADPPRVVAVEAGPSGSEADAATTPSVRTSASRKPRIDTLVKRFDTAGAAEPSVSPTRTRQLPPRPPIARRGRSDLTRSQIKVRPAQDVFSDGEVVSPRRSNLPPPPRITQRGGSLILPAKPPTASTSRSRVGTSPEKSTHRPTMPSRNPSTASSSKSVTVGRRTGGESSSSGPTTRSRAASGSGPAGASSSATAVVRPVHAPRKSATTAAGARVSTLARHYDKLSREAERDRQRRLALSRGRRARPVAVSKPTLDVYDTTRDALKEDSDEEGESNAGGSADDEFDDEVEEQPAVVAAKAAPTATKPSLLEGRGPPPGLQHRVVVQPTINELIDAEAAAALVIATSTALVPLASSSGGEASTPSSVAPSPRLDVGFDGLPLVSRVPTLSEGEMSSSGTERSSILKTISSLWQYRGCDYLPLEYPLLASEHIFANQTVIVREDEPSSLIAFALRCVRANRPC